MYCTNCGIDVGQTAITCTNCGFSPHAEKKPLREQMSDKLSEKLTDIFGQVSDERRKYYHENPTHRPSAVMIDALIAKYSYVNGGIAVAANLVPGPWGMLAVVPEIVLVIRNQLKLIYDIGVAQGNERFLNAELLMAVFAASMGGGALGLVTVKAGQLVVKRTSLRIIQKIIVWLGGKVTQRLLKQILSKWIPIVGAAAMGYWAKVTTEKVGRFANDLLSKEIVKDDSPPDES